MCMLRDPGVGTGKSVSWSERARKKFGRRKVKKERKTPWGQCFNGPGNLDDGYKYYFVFYYYSSWTRKSTLCDITLTLQCLSYLPGQCDERFLRIGKVSVTASDVRNEGKKSHFAHESEIPKHLSTESVQKLAISLRLQLRYLRKVQRISGEFLADMLNDFPYILCCEWNFSPRVNPLRTTETNMATN